MSSQPTVRVRFAPSPTGYLHVGGARTALFNWLLARKVNGIFVLRIEDTDQDRNNPAMVAAILEGLTWLDLSWDEGPYHQADGFARHRADALRLVESGAAYRCFCTPEELERKRAAAGEGYRYDRTCAAIPPAEAERRANAGEPHTIRFRVPDGMTAWEDVVHGRIEFANDSLDDFIILRTDGTPIYNLAVVSDDIEHRITHVIRGTDHISNTPKQILIYQALGQPLPVFAHVPMILGPDGKRLSKRHGATAVGDYQHQGILAPALRNFLALLGWSPGEDKEILSLPEMIERFSLEGINKKSAVFDVTKLVWMNGQYISALSAEDLAPLVAAALAAKGIDTEELLRTRREWFLQLIDLLKTRARVVTEIAEQALPYLTRDVTYNSDAVKKHWKDREVPARLGALRDSFATVTEWTPAVLEQHLRGVSEALGIAGGKLIHPLRVALLGTAVGPGIFDVLAALGREVSLQRIDSAREFVASSNGGSNAA
jgi:glutamyl-tRNA synthetase